MNDTVNSRIINHADIRQFTEKSDWRGALLVVNNWALIFSAFLISAVWSHWLTYLFSIILIANRQLGISILMHDASHHLLFKSKVLNLWVGRVFCGAPVIADLDSYRTYHLQHHKKAGTKNDPDYPNYQIYPVSKASFIRKVLRDLSGLTGLKNLYGLYLMNAGFLNYDFVYKSNGSPRHKLSIVKAASNLFKGLWLPILSNVLLWLVLFSLGHGVLYWLWVIAYLTVYQLFLRIRNAAEHAAVPDLLSSDPFQHARTTVARWWERLTVAPNYVNYHLEHHLRPTIPCYRLRQFHFYLRSKGYYEETRVAQGYGDVIKMLIHKA